MSNYKTITREELYNEVWARPIRDIAKDFGISDVGLRKICIKLDIPLPGAGYWRKIEVGQVIDKPHLPPLKPGGLSEYHFHMHTSEKKSVLSEEEKAVLNKIESDSKHIVVKTRLINIHPVIDELVTELKSGYVSYGRLIRRKSSSQSIRVSSDQLNRAARILDALVRAIEAQNFKVHREDYVLFTLVNDIKIKIVIKEEVKRIENKTKDQWSFDNYDYMPTGKLTLCIEGLYTNRPIKRNFSDSSAKPVESQLGLFIVALIHASHARKEYELVLEEERRQWKEKERARLEEERLLGLKKEQIKDLFRTVKQFKRYQSIREFLELYRDNLDNSSFSPEDRADVAAWLNWAESYVEKKDPLKKKKALFK